MYAFDKQKAICTKKKKAHPNLSPGILTVFCPHGVSCGFQLLKDVESPKTPFTVLATRFPKPPKFVIYDNACNLHEYVLNR